MAPCVGWAGMPLGLGSGAGGHGRRDGWGQSRLCGAGSGDPLVTWGLATSGPAAWTCHGVSCAGSGVCTAERGLLCPSLYRAWGRLQKVGCWLGRCLQAAALVAWSSRARCRVPVRASPALAAIGGQGTADVRRQRERSF